MRILWIADASMFTGCAEAYIFHTVKLLKDYKISSTLLYDPSLECKKEFLATFADAQPLNHLSQQLGKIPHDIIYVHQLTDLSQLAVLAETEAPVVKFFHDYKLFGIEEHQRLILNAHRSLDAFVTISEYLAQKALSYGFAPQKLIPIPPYPYLENSRNLTHLEREKYLMLFVGELNQSTGLDLLLKGMALLPADYHLNVVGSGSSELEYKQLANSLKIESRVNFLGKQSQEMLSELYKRCACVVIPSRLPLACTNVGIEAMQYGTPVVATDCGGIKEWLEEAKCGFIVPHDPPEALSIAIQKICEHPSLAEQLGCQAKIIVQSKFSPHIHASTLKSAFEQLIADKKRRQRFTFYGSAAAEETIAQILNEVKAVIQQTIPEDHYRCALLIGSYAKGEGGIVVHDGKEHPHNNIDIVLISHDISKSQQQSYKLMLDHALEDISQHYGIGLDTSLISTHAIKSPSPTLLFYELYYGHKVLLGDSSFISSLPLGDFAAVPPTEFQALLANRGTLLIINDWLLDNHPTPSVPIKKVIVKHIMKAIIGFGDAWLYFLGAYHWSYCERLLRVQMHRAIPQSFKELYEISALFRFKPDYDKYIEQDLYFWMAETRVELTKSYLSIERLRMLNPAVDEHNILEESLREMWAYRPKNMHGWLKSWGGLLSKPKMIVGRSLKAKMAFTCLLPRQRLTALFPLVAFGWGDDLAHYQAAGYMHSEGDDPKQLTAAYLKLWGELCDINFTRSLKVGSQI